MQDKRRAPRIEESAEITVKVQSAPQARDLEGRTLPFNSKDISLDGLRLHVDTPVPVGALLELKVQFNDSADKFWHTGSVVWNNEASSLVGVKFNLDANPQFTSWKEAVNRLLERR